MLRPRPARKPGLRAVIAVLALAAFALAAAPKVVKLKVQVRSAPVYQDASYLSRITKKLPYATEVAVLKSTGSWMRIVAAGDSGWVQKSSLAEKVDRPASGKPGPGGSSSEVLLAGKGFSQEVEDRYRHDHAELEAAYARLDSLTLAVPDHDSLIAFARTGRLLGVKP